MPAAQSAQFQQSFIGDENNTLIEYSAYQKSASVPKANADTNLTTLAVGGGPVTGNHRRGSIQAQPQLDLFFDPVPLDNLSRVVGGNGGVTVQLRGGVNAAPSSGDMLYQGSFTLFGINLTYNRGQEAQMTLDFKPTDQGAIRPDWYPA